MTASPTLQDLSCAAIAAHDRWKARFRDFTSGMLVLDLTEIAWQDACPFGRWLQQDGPHHVDPETYTELHALHTRFHQLAATMIQLIHDGHTTQVRGMMSPNGLFTQTSTVLTIHVRRLRAMAAEHQECE
jgi:Chemoreceptor zinc-binding domain